MPSNSNVKPHSGVLQSPNEEVKITCANSLIISMNFLLNSQNGSMKCLEVKN